MVTSLWTENAFPYVTHRNNQPMGQKFTEHETMVAIRLHANFRRNPSTNTLVIGFDGSLNPLILLQRLSPFDQAIPVINMCLFFIEECHSVIPCL